MKMFKKSDQTKFFVTNTFQLDRQKSYNRPDNLIHVMHLFEEKSKYAATPVNGPLPIKANGAIVVNRPHPKKNGTIRSLPIYLQDDEEEEEEEEIKTPVNTSEIISTPIVKEEENHSVDLIHEENKRLRQQILLEREQYEKWRISKEKLEHELEFAHHTIKNMQRIIDRFQSLNLLSGKSFSDKNSRRQSTGVTFDYLNTSHVVKSYEHKLQILLNEIDAMETQEKESLKKSLEQKKECKNTIRRLKYKDDIIRQLAYDLQFERNSRQL